MGSLRWHCCLSPDIVIEGGENMKRRGHNIRTMTNIRFVYMTHEGKNSLPQW